MPKKRSTAGGKQKKTSVKPLALKTDVPITRRLQTPKRLWYKPLTWRYREPAPVYKPLPKARYILRTALQTLWQHKKLFGSVVLVYGVLNILLVRGLSGSSDLGTIKASLDAAAHGFGGKVASSAASFLYLLVSSGSNSAQNSGVYQSILLIICSLAFIWAFRQTLAKHAINLRDCFYHGMYPLIPFVLVFLLLGLQLVPFAIGSGLYSTIISNGIAVHLWEKGLWLLAFLLLAWWSLRMITASIFALYIVTLPDMAPLQAYRSAKKLVYGRRLLIWRKLIFLPVVLLLIATAVEVPLILLVTPVAAWVFFVLSMLALPVTHSYLYTLYREML